MTRKGTAWLPARVAWQRELRQSHAAALAPTAGGIRRSRRFAAPVVPRPDRLRDAVRTAGALGWLLGRMLVERRRAPDSPGPDTTTADRLELLRAACRQVLGRMGVRVEVEHAERVPRDGGLVFMWNQTSHLDHAVLPLAIPRPFYSTYNNEVRKVPLYGAHLRRMGHFWLDRNDEAQWRQQLTAAADAIRGGACVLISPEGTRSWDGRLLPMKRGAFFLARAAERPIVCVTVIGARELLPRGRAAVRPGTIRVVLGTPIGVDASTEPHLEQLVTDEFARTLRAHGLPA